MKITQIETLRCIIGEGPVWDVAEQALYFIDILGKKVLRFDPASEATQSWDVPDVIGSMAVRANGGAVVALATGVHTLDFETGACATLATSTDLNEMVQLADGKVDRRGRFIVGSSDRGDGAKPWKLYVLEGCPILREIDNDIIIANGPCWSPDNSIPICVSLRPRSGFTNGIRKLRAFRSKNRIPKLRLKSPTSIACIRA